MLGTSLQCFDNKSSHLVHKIVHMLFVLIKTARENVLPIRPTFSPEISSSSFIRILPSLRSSKTLTTFVSFWGDKIWFLNYYLDIISNKSPIQKLECTVIPVCRVWHFSTRYPVCKGKTSDVPVCTNNFWCALTNFLPGAVKIWAICILINAKDHDLPPFCSTWR